MAILSSAALGVLFVASFAPVEGIQVECLENLRGTTGRARIEIVVAAGALHEGENERGVAHLLEHVLLRPLDFDDSNGSTTWSYTNYHRDVSGAELLDASRRLIQAIASSTFSESALEVEKKIVLRELEDRNASRPPLTDILFGRTILARYPGGSADSVRQLTLDDARSFHRRHYRRGNIAISARGATDCSAFLEMVTAEADSIARGPKAELPRVTEREPGSRSLPGIGGSDFIAGFYWYDSSLESELAWRLVSAHLGQQALDELRKKRGLTYSPRASVARRAGGGSLQLVVTTGGDLAAVSDWYKEEVKTLRATANPFAEFPKATKLTRTALSADGAFRGLAAIYGWPPPLEVLEELESGKRSVILSELLAPRREFGRQSATSNAGSSIVLIVVGLLVLGFFGLLAKKLLRP